MIVNERDDIISVCPTLQIEGYKGHIFSIDNTFTNKTKYLISESGSNKDLYINILKKRYDFDFSTDDIFTDKIKRPVSESDSNKDLYAGVLEKAKNKFKKLFLYNIRESDFEYGFSSQAEEFLIIELKKYNVYCREWVNELYFENINNVEIVVGLLRVISHISYDDIFPAGMTIAAASLSHKSIIVKENAIRAFENWEDARNVRFLENMECADPFLKDYLNNVINDLGKKENASANQKN